ncbi:MAG: UDP-3-O-[3-hydroxymyristoyl] glucosamine N-acyltransferase [Alteromonadaceae bacterium]|jgi:UDP-3-O-[3-hydroxymyristoyl] glucosamine N-acyltransferase
MTFTLGEIAKTIGGKLVGDENCQVTRITTLQKGVLGCISFLTNQKYRSQLADSKASAVLLHPNEVENCQQVSDINIIVMDNPYLGYALLAQMMDTTPSASAGIAASAVVDSTAVVAATASIGEHTVIAAGVVIEDNVIIGSGCFVGQNTLIKADSRLWANVTIYHDIVIGKACLFQAGVVIGSDGFGYAPHAGTWVKIPQLGGVTIGDNVEIGANSCVDRGALDDTLIGDGVIIDNQCHVAHNVSIGDHSALAGGAMVAGSTNIGSGCIIAGRVGIAGHLNITDNVTFTGMCQVLQDIKEPGSQSSGMASMPTKQWRKVNVRIRQLDDMYQKIRKNEKAITRLTLLQQDK